LGDESVHAKAIEPSESLASYSVQVFSAHDLPPEFRNLIYSKWLRSLRYGNDYFKLIDPDAYYRAYQTYITYRLGQIDCVVRLAVLTDEPDVVLGFSLCHGNILEYVHVHKDHRRQGIGTKLVPGYIDTITHVTKIGLSIWGSKYSHWKFNPFA
jgi:GNAT superfamily N-acetyltransferase